MPGSCEKFGGGGGGGQSFAKPFDFSIQEALQISRVESKIFGRIVGPQWSSGNTLASHL